MSTEGYIKFDYQLDGKPIDYPSEVAMLNEWRSRLHQAGLIGVYPNGVGFGNVSIRLGSSEQFLISASATGGLSHLKPEHYVKVVAFDFDKNFVWCQGVSKPSSESLSHAMFYHSSAAVVAVVHVHNLKLWTKLSGRAPTTSAEIEYGTVQMAREIESLFRQHRLSGEGLLVMAGHREGLFSFGPNLADAVRVLQN
jgi:L-ribulose-5-phosphate 4-epimerase